MQFNKVKMHLDGFYKHVEDWNVIWKYVWAKMQFYKVKCKLNVCCELCKGLKCNFKTCRG